MKRFLVCMMAFISLTTLFVSCQKEDLTVKNKEAAPESLVMGASGVALPHTKQYSAGVATDWFNLLAEITRTKPYFVGQALRIFAYSGIALYESVVPGMPSYQSMLEWTL